MRPAALALDEDAADDPFMLWRPTSPQRSDPS